MQLKIFESDPMQLAALDHLECRKGLKPYYARVSGRGDRWRDVYLHGPVAESSSYNSVLQREAFTSY